jgi:hypothetical protein
MMASTRRPDPTPSPASWTQIRELVDLSLCNAHFKAAANWALDTLQAKLGDEWLGRAASLSDESFPLGLHVLGSHTHALAEALEWALRLEMCTDWEGSADFLRDLIRDPRSARILHSRSQLAQASLAARLGWPVALEPKGEGGAPADLAIAAPSGRIVAEVRILTPSEFGRAQRNVAESTTDWLFWLGQEYGIWIGGDLGRDPTEGERQEIEGFVKREASRTKKGERPRYSSDGIALRLSERGAGAPGLTSPPVRENLFDRMVRVITEKAERMQASGGQWLHATVLTGLWAFTDWGRGPLPSKAPVMSSALTAALGDRCPAGIVLTSASGLAPEDMEEETAKSSAGISLRVGIQALRARESLILTFRREASQAANDWLSLARAEANWLSWALAEKNLPTIGEMLVGEP